jgi:hypothetical protein
MVKVDDKEYHKIICENQVLKNMIKNLHVFSQRAEAMSYEGFFKTSKTMLDSFVHTINEDILIGEGVIDKTLLETESFESESDSENENFSELG